MSLCKIQKVRFSLLPPPHPNQSVLFYDVIMIPLKDWMVLVSAHASLWYFSAMCLDQSTRKYKLIIKLESGEKKRSLSQYD